MKFHERLRDLRKFNQMTQEELSMKMGISAAAIGLYEQGRRNPDNETLIKLASIFDVSVDYLLGFEEVKVNATPAFDEFTYAFANETRGMTLEEKKATLAMVQAFKANLGK